MRVFARLLTILITVSCLMFLVSSSVRAEGEFETDYKVNYTIDKNGVAIATFDITLENKTANFYADKFDLKIGSTKVTDVVARDSGGELQTEVKFENNTTAIGTKFSQRVIGLGKTLNWTLTYKTTELAIKSGQIWEISIPKIANAKDTGTYELTVTVPSTLGPKAFALPGPKLETAQGTNTTFTFDKDQLVTSGIALSFGEKQVFSYNLKYYLENTNITSQTLDVTLPPDNNYQKVVIGKIEPKPNDVVVDSDGNFIAKYKLKPKEKLEVNVTGDVEVFSKPFRKITQKLTEDEKNIFTQPQSYWEVDNTQIREKAQELKTPQAIYDYVAKTLKYNSERLTSGKLERKGATAALADPNNAVCMEFTDLFIAIARAANIPTREIEGYAFTQNDRLRPLSLNIYENDLLHAWPEYWDEERGWVQIDPTWASTSGGLDYFNKLDFNHITFVQRGKSSAAPNPAGAYKNSSNSQEKTVYVQFAQNLPDTTPSSDIKIDLPKKAISAFPLKVVVTVQNTAATSIIGEKITLTSDLTGVAQIEETIPILPPYSQKTFTLSFQTKGLLKSQSIQIFASFAKSETASTINVKPFYWLVTDPVFIVSAIAVIVITSLGLYFYKRHHAFPKIHFNKNQQ